MPILDVGTSRFEQLPATRTLDESFKVLVSDSGEPVDDDWMARRREHLLRIFDRERPDILVTELYPFGRRQMRFELDPLLAHARVERQQSGLPIIVSSVRDILVPSKKPGRDEEIVERLRRYYDLVLIHGDEAVIPFEWSFARANEIDDMTCSTGYVVGAVPSKQGPGASGYDEVIVSIGGGAVGADLLEAALGARALCRLRERTWRILIGHGYPEDAFRSFRAAAPAGVRVERARGDFTQLLANCALSISQGGYNTVAEILATGARAVCLPFAGGGETEQTLRCRILAERGLLQCVEKGAVSARQVALAVDRALESVPNRAQTVDTRGASRSADLLLELLRSRRREQRHGELES